MFGKIVEEKFPLRHAPHIGLFMPIEADQERSDEIEFSQVGQGIERFDRPDHATHPEQPGNISKHGELIQIEPEPFVAKQLSDVEKISRAATKIENAFRSRQIELDHANPADVDIDPSFEIKKFGPVSAETFDGVPLANLLETLAVDRFDHSLRREGKTVHLKKPERVPSGAGQSSAIHKFLKFMGKFFDSMANSHRTIDHSLWRSATISTKLQMT